jgi:hypothetical protein
MFKKFILVACVLAGSIVSFKVGRGSPPQVQVPAQAQACSDEEMQNDPQCWCGCCMQCPTVGCGACGE